MGSADSTSSCLIDCHVLTMPRHNPIWAAELRADLDSEPVYQHWLPGIAGQAGRARESGFSLGSAPFVAFADPDSRIISGTFAALLAALLDNPGAPFAWAGDQPVDAELRPVGRARVLPQEYDQRMHRNDLQGYCRGVQLIRRSAIAAALVATRHCHVGAEGLFLAHVAQVGAAVPEWRRPVHLPIVGRLSRPCPGASHDARCQPTTAYTAADQARNEHLLGFAPQYLHGGQRQAPAPCLTCGPPRR